MSTLRFFQGVDMNNVDISDSVIVSNTSTKVVIEYNGGIERVDFFGTNFTFSSTSVTGGTVTRIDDYAFGQLVFRYETPGVSAVTVANYFVAEDTVGLLTFLLSAGDEIHASSFSDRLFSLDGNDVVFGNGGNDALFGGNGNDIIFGGSGNDFLIGENGNDSLSGGSGDDFVYGDDGDDRLFGNRGNDTLDERNDDGDDTLNGGAGRDVLFGGAGDDRLVGGSDKDILIGGAGNDSMSGGGGRDRLVGEGGSDVLTGRGGRDELYGGDSRDTLKGGGGKDLLYGGNGKDTLIGGGGDDILTGGTRDDLFIFSNNSGADIIRDFTTGAGSDDVIELLSITGFNSFADVQAAASQVGSTTVIDLGGDDQITLLGVNVGDLHQDDFIFT